MSAKQSNITLVPTRKGEAPLLAVQRRRWAMRYAVRSCVYVAGFVACTLASGCDRADDVQVPAGWLQSEEVRKVTGTIRYLDIEGGCWAIDIGDRRLEPIDLDDSFKVDGLAVSASVRAENDKITICMIGQMVSVVDIHKR